MQRTVLLLLVLLTVSMVSGQEETLLLRFPTIHEHQIVFGYGGDLYTVADTGGIARRLTTHDGYEAFPRFSHDGRHIAFTGQYDGNTEVYVMPATGGVPTRLTVSATLGRDAIWDRMGPNNIVMGWSHDNQRILFRSRMREFNSFKGHLFTVGLDGDVPTQLPLPRGGFASFSADDQKLAYNRVFREFRTWKRYRGGMADDIWIYDFQSKETRSITDHPAQDIIPMWSGNRVYFLSDRGEQKRMNLYVYDLETKSLRRLTDFSEFDIKFPSLGDAAIVFENGGALYRFDLAGEELQRVPVTIANDLVVRRDKLEDVSDKVRQYEIAPDGKRAVFGARGEVFTVPAENGPTRNVTDTPALHERAVKWSPDGTWLAYISDATGETEIFIQAGDRSGNPVQVTRDADTYKFKLQWSPDSKKLLWSDKKLRLRMVDIHSKQVKTIATAKAWEYTQFDWSPDSRWVAYTQVEEDTKNRIYLYSLEQDTAFAATEGWYASGSPEFGADGEVLYFVSDRHFEPTWSQGEWSPAYLDMSRLFLVTLNKSVESPLKPRSDEVATETESEEEKKEEKKESDVTVTVDPDGLADRIVALPVQPSRYRHLTSVDDRVFYIRKGSDEKKARLLSFDFDKRKETDHGEIGGYEISADGKKMLVGRNKSYAIIDLPSAEITMDTPLDLSDMTVQLNRRAEWRQIFNECWRHMRDFFYDPGMHGVDWEAMRKQYAPLVEHVAHRADLTYVIGEMIGELNVGHAYVGGGDMPDVERIKTGLLGAQLERDPDSRAYSITRILDGENWTDDRRSPLTEVGVDVSEGDYILAVNGEAVSGMDNIYTALINTVGDQVTLTVNSEPDTEGSREITVVPIADEAGLYYYNWVHSNIEKVNEATDGQVGYIHLPDMGAPGLNEFYKYFFPQLRKKGLIIDVRGNGGGMVSPLIIERLRRELALFDVARNTSVSTNPSQMHYGPKVTLMDEFSASDGDLFPYRFRKHNIGPLIGKRTWGGVVGIRSSLPLLDGGYLYKPEFASFGTEGKEWVIEGRGVEPDIVVDNDPAREYRGVDQQLNRAIEEILKKIEQEKPMLPSPPPYPDKTPEQN